MAQESLHHEKSKVTSDLGVQGYPASGTSQCISPQARQETVLTGSEHGLMEGDPITKEVKVKFL